MVVLFSVLWKDSSSQFSEQSEILVHLEVAYRKINQASEER